MIFSYLRTTPMFVTGFLPPTNRTLFRQGLELHHPVYNPRQFKLNWICTYLRSLPMHHWNGSRPNYRGTSSPTTLAGAETGVRPAADSPVGSRAEPPVRNVDHAVTADPPLPTPMKAVESSGNLSAPSLPRSHPAPGITLTNPSPHSANLTRLIFLMFLGEEGRGQIPPKALRFRPRLLHRAACRATLMRCPTT